MKQVDLFYRDGGNNLLYTEMADANNILILGGYVGNNVVHIINHSNANVYIIEPVKQFYDQLVNKFKDNNNVHILNVGVLDKNIVSTLELANDGTSLFNNSGKGIFRLRVKCQFCTVTEILHRFGIDNETIDVLYCNCEGGEYYALPELIQNKKILKYKKLLIQYHNYNDFCINTRNEIRTSLTDLGYDEQFNYEFVWEYWKK
jgi:FkbM family methyltransferase